MEFHLELFSERFSLVGMLRLPSRQLLRCLRGNLISAGEELSNPVFVTANITTSASSCANSLIVKPTQVFIRQNCSTKKRAFSTDHGPDQPKSESTSPDSSSESPAVVEAEKAEIKTVTLAELLKLSERKPLHHRTALYIVSNLAKLKGKGVVKEDDYKVGLHAVLKVLEGNAVKDMQPLALLSCLKVRECKKSEI